MSQPLPLSIKRPASPLLWAVFLACSWTWCIGMFLPVLLVRDYGVWGWVVFAVPNVIGAAAMGWVIRSRATSRRMVRDHRAACVAFSLVTICFQAFFATAYLPKLPAFSVLVPIILIPGLLTLKTENRKLQAAAATWLFSCFALIYFLASPHAATVATAPHSHAHLIPITLVCVFGFLLCPYLDLTFHEARQNLDERASAFAFTAGFGFFFLVMIFFTLCYAPALALGQAVSAVVWLHIFFQLMFTIRVHEKATQAAHVSPVLFWTLFLVGIVIGLFAAGGEAVTDRRELVYRLFLAFYGLIFPGYVFHFMLRRFKGYTPMSSRNIQVFVAAVLVAIPAYWLAFVRGHMFWLFAGVGVVLLACLLMEREPEPIIPPS